jgi:hypothetical protein
MVVLRLPLASSPQPVLPRNRRRNTKVLITFQLVARNISTLLHLPPLVPGPGRGPWMKPTSISSRRSKTTLLLERVPCSNGVPKICFPRSKVIGILREFNSKHSTSSNLKSMTGHGSLSSLGHFSARYLRSHASSYILTFSCRRVRLARIQSASHHSKVGTSPP